jgi:RimJ/RimL family protein N-acetyltransferase
MQLTVSRLGPADHVALARLLDQDSLQTAYLRSEMRLNPSMANWWGIGGGGEVRAAFLGGPLVVPWIPDPSDAPALLAAIHQQGFPRMLVGAAGSVRALADVMRPWRVPVEVRDPQPLLSVGDITVPATAPLRRATRAELDALTAAAAAMHREEMGVDPLTVDSAGWRNRMTALVDRGWSFIWSHAGEIVFKAELSAWTPEAVQIQGVWTDPRWRRRGVALAGMATLCDLLLRDVPACTLYVNDYNLAATRLYAKLGFRRIGDFATLMY